MEIKIRVEENKPNINLQLKDTIVVYREGEPQTLDLEYVENGEYIITPDDGVVLENVNIKVNVPIPEGYIKPEGTITIEENGTIDVTEYATVNVNVSNSGDEELVEDFIGVISGALTGHLVIPEGTTVLKTSIFAQLPISSVEIPNTVTTIGSQVFSVCPNLTYVTIPSSVESLGRNVFSMTGSADNKLTVRMESTTPPTISSNTFYTNYLQAIEVPMSAVDTYKTATNWSNFADYIIGYTEE